MQKMKNSSSARLLLKKEVDYYLSYNNIYVCDGEANSLKDIVPDVTKCEFTVYCYGKKAEVKSISDIEWNEKNIKGKRQLYFFNNSSTRWQRVYKDC